MFVAVSRQTKKAIVRGILRGSAAKYLLFSLRPLLGLRLSKGVFAVNDRVLIGGNLRKSAVKSSSDALRYALCALLFSDLRKSAANISLPNLAPFVVRPIRRAHGPEALEGREVSFLSNRKIGFALMEINRQT